MNKYFYLLILFFVTGCLEPVHDPEGNKEDLPSQDVDGAEKTAFTVINTYCLSCHAEGKASATVWGKIKNQEELDTFAFSGSERILPSTPDTSILILRMVHGPGDQSMPPGKTSMNIAEYKIVYEWIKKLKTPSTEDPPVVDPPPVVVLNTAYKVVDKYCLSCHNNGVSAPSWGNITSQESLNSFAYSNTTNTIVPGSLLLSNIIQRSKHGPGDQSMPPGISAMTIEHYNVLSTWIAGLTPKEEEPPPVVVLDTPFKVVNTYCLTCHNNGTAAPSWGNITSESNFNTFAYNNLGSRIVPGNTSASSIIQKMKHGTGDQTMPPGSTTMTKAHYDIVFNWIAGLTPPVVEPPPVVDTAYKVINTYCLSCHNNGAYAPSWGNITSETDLNTFAYSSGARITPGNPSTSTLILRMKHGTGDQSMPPGTTTMTSTHYTLVFNWIAGLTPGPIIEPPPVDPPEDPPGTGLATSNSEKLRLGDRRYVASVFKDVFGASAATSTNSYVLARVSKFGGACDLADSYAYTFPTTNRCNEPGPAMVSELVNVEGVNLYAPRIPISTLDREGFRMLNCQQILMGDNTALTYTIQKVRGSSDMTFLNSTPKPTDAEITKMYKLFFPGRTPKPRIVNGLKNVSDVAQSAPLSPVGGNGVKYESWRYVLYTLCKAPDWQAE